jgi:predicted nucleotidyltransferase
MVKRINNLRKIGRDVAKAIRDVPGVVAVAAYGSVAEGHVDKFSDINLVAICSKIPKPESRKKVLQKSYEWIVFKNDIVPKWRTAAQDFFFVNGEHVDVTYKSKKYFDTIADSVSKNHRISREIFREIMIYVYNTHILYDPLKVINKIRNNLPKATPQMVRYFLPDLNKLTTKGSWPNNALNHAILDKNYLYINNLLDLELENFIISLYVLNKKHYTSPKWAMYSIKEFKFKPKSTFKRLQEVALLGNKQVDLKRKINLMQSLTADLNKLILKEKVFGIVE